MNTEPNTEFKNPLITLESLDSFDNEYDNNKKLIELKINNEKYSSEGLVTGIVIVGLLVKLTQVGLDILVDTVKTKIRINLENKNRLDNLTKNKSSIERSAKETNYQKLSRLKFPAPVGIKVSLLVMGKELDSIGKLVFKDLLDMLDTYSILLSIAISNDLERKTNKSIIKFSKDVAIKDKQAAKSLGSMLKKGSNEDTRTLGSMMGNSKEIVELLNITDMLSNIYTIETMNSINDKVNMLADKMEVLIGELKDGHIDNISKPVVQDLVNGSEVIAKYVTSASALYNTYNQYLYTVIKIAKHIKD